MVIKNVIVPATAVYIGVLRLVAATIKPAATALVFSMKLVQTNARFPANAGARVTAISNAAITILIPAWNGTA